MFAMVPPGILLLLASFVVAASGSQAPVTHVDVLVQNLAYSELKKRQADVSMLSKSVAWTLALFFDIDASRVKDLQGQPEHVHVAAGEMLMPWSKKSWPVATTTGGNHTYFSAAVNLPGLSEMEIEAKLKTDKFKHRLAQDITETLGESSAIAGALRVTAVQAATVGRPAPRQVDESTLPSAPLPPMPPAPSKPGRHAFPTARANAKKKLEASPVASEGVPIFDTVLLVAGCAILLAGVGLCAREVKLRHAAKYNQCFESSPRNMTWRATPPEVPTATAKATAFLGSLVEKRPVGYTGP